MERNETRSPDKGRVKAAFSVEISNDIPSDAKDWNEYRPYKFLCGSIAYSDEDRTIVTCRNAEAFLGYLISEVFNLYSWNGLGFGFVVLADSTKQLRRCITSSNLHTDIMFDFFCRHGYPISLLSVAHGFGFDDEVEAIMTNNEKITNWAKKDMMDEIEAHSRMKADLILRVVEKIEESRGLVWVNGKGQLVMETIDKILPVHEAMKLPLPDVSYMTNPMTRESFIRWQRV